jgi:ribosomal protein S18 acetylase RimI-like enzyme
MVTLRRMTEDEFARFRADSVEHYAHERARNLGTTHAEERAAAERQYEQLLGDGLQSAGHLFWKIVTETDDLVGNLWAYRQGDSSQAFLYFIEIAEDQRGRGYGEQALRLLEEALQGVGVTRIVLNVFADNAPAAALYRKLGYRVTNMNMRKEIESRRAAQEPEVGIP